MAPGPAVGIAGVGRMGTAAALRLNSLGFPVTVANRTAAVASELAATSLAFPVQIALVLIAFGLTSLVGLERRLRRKSAGLRTHALVGTGPGAANYGAAISGGWKGFFDSLPDDFFDGSVPQPGRLLVRWARRDALYRPIQALLGAVATAAGTLRLGVTVTDVDAAAGTVVAGGGWAAGSGRSLSVPMKSMRPSSVLRSISIRTRSPSRRRPIGPPASASGPTWPMQAPVDTPEKRASVSTGTCLPQGRCLSAEVSW